LLRCDLTSVNSIIEVSKVGLQGVDCGRGSCEIPGAFTAGLLPSATGRADWSRGSAETGAAARGTL
jgi:hypothetical protein